MSGDADWKPTERRVRKGLVIGGPWDGRLVANDTPWLRVPVVELAPIAAWGSPGSTETKGPCPDIFTYVFVDDDNTWRLQ